MFCAKINADCPHRVIQDSSYVFVLMPFENSASIFDCIKQAVENLPTKKFTCDRADVRYTSSDIWCQKICRAIRRAKYLIVDTTGLNANVFYELGFAHALGQTRNIIITQKIEELPFDVKGYSAILYSEKNFPKLREDLQRALTDLEAETGQETPATKTPDEIISDLKAQIRAEEERSEKFKQQAREAEIEIEKLNQRIEEIQAIKRNPKAEAKKLIAEKDREIEKLQQELNQFDQQKKEEMTLLQKRLEEEQQLRQRLEQELARFNQTGDTQKLTQTTSDAKAKDWQAELLNTGKKLRDEKKYDEAIAIFTQIIDKASDNQRAFWYRASCLYRSKDYEGAISDYTKAIELDSKDETAFNNRGLAYAALQDYDRAIADYSQAIALDPKFAAAFHNRGNAYAELKDYDRAIADFSQAIALDPKLALAFNNRGTAYAELKDYDRAIADYSQAIALDSKFALAFIGRGLAYADLKDYDRAIADYSQAIALDPKYAAAFYNRGNAYFNLKDYDRASADFSQAIALDPKYISAYQDLAELLIMAGKATDAEQTVRHALGRAITIRDQAIIQYLLAVALKLQGKKTAEQDQTLAQLCNQEFELGWSFEGFESWLAEAELAADVKSYIQEKTELLKQHKK